MTHSEMNELYELYVLGVLEPQLALEIEGHLTANCEYCRAHLQAATELTAALASTAEPVPLPARLRRCVLNSIAPSKATRNWMVFGLTMSAACAALIIISIVSQLSLRNAQEQLAPLIHERDQLRSAIEILSRPETRTVEFGKTESVPHGRVLVSRTGEIVLVASNLPELPSNQTLELWLVPPAGAPKAAGLFRPDISGSAVEISPVKTGTQISAVAVSIEPRQGSSAPTTKPILVVPLA